MIDSKPKTEDFWQNEELHVFYEKSFKKVHEDIETILSIIALNTDGKPELNALYELIWKYKTFKSNINIFHKVFRYRVYDFIEYGCRQKFPFLRQTYLLEKLDLELKDKPNDEFLHIHIFECIKTLMVLDFEGESFYDKYTHTFSWSRHHVYQNGITEQIRIDALQLLFRIYDLARHNQYSEDFFDHILMTLYFMSKGKQEKYEFDKSKEFDLVVDFLSRILIKEPSIKERSKIIRQLRIYERREIKEEYKAIRGVLLEKSETVSTPKEKLALLFLDEYFSFKKNIENIFNQLIALYQDNTSFYRDVIEVKIEQIQNNFSNFSELLSYLIKNHLDMSKDLLELVINEYPEQVCDFSTLIKANYQDNKYFYSAIDKIWNLDFDCTKGSVLWMLTYGRNGEVELYREEDLKYFEYVVEGKFIKQLGSTSFTLGKYIFINPERTLNIIASIFKIRENKREDGYLLHSIFEEKAILEDHTKIIKEFVFSNTEQFPIDYHYLGEVLNFLEDYFGFETFFCYLQEKIEFIEKNKKSIYLLHHKRYTNPNKTSIQYEKDFIHVVKWYSGLETKSEYTHKVLVEFLRPDKIETEDFKKGFKELVEATDGNINKIIDLCKALDVFENREEQLISLLIEVANDICEKFKLERSQLIAILGYNYIQNSYMKSGPAGGPFPQDLDRKKELIEIMKKYEMHHEVKSTFEYALNIVNEDIDRDLFNDEKW